MQVEETRADKLTSSPLRDGVRRDLSKEAWSRECNWSEVKSAGYLSSLLNESVFNEHKQVRQLTLTETEIYSCSSAEAKSLLADTTPLAQSNPAGVPVCIARNIYIQEDQKEYTSEHFWEGYEKERGWRGIAEAAVRSFEGGPADWVRGKVKTPAPDPAHSSEQCTLQSSLLHSDNTNHTKTTKFLHVHYLVWD